MFREFLISQLLIEFNAPMMKSAMYIEKGIENCCKNSFVIVLQGRTGSGKQTGYCIDQKAKASILSLRPRIGGVLLARFSVDDV